MAWSAGLASIGMRRGDPQARMIADPAVRANPLPFIEDLRSRGRIVRTRVAYLTVDYEIAHDLLRSDDFRVTELGANLPKPLRWVTRRPNTGLLHPLEPPSLLSVEPPEHTRYRKLVSSVFTSRAVAALRDRVEETAKVLLDDLGRTARRRRHRRALLLAASGHGDRRHPRRARSRTAQQILKFGELGAPSLDVGLPGGSTGRCTRASSVSTTGWPTTCEQPASASRGRLAEPAHPGGRRRAVGSTTENCRPPPAWCLRRASRPRSTCWATGSGC